MDRKKSIKLASGTILATLVLPAWYINPVFGILTIAAIAPILFISSNRFSVIGKSIVAGCYLFVAVLFLQASLSTYGIYWGDDFIEDGDVIINTIVITSKNGNKTSIPVENFSEIRRRAALARSTRWTTDWIKLRGTPWVDHFTLYVDADNTRDYRLEFRENEAIQGEIIAFLHIEAPKGYKTKEHPDQLSGVFYVNELFEYLKVFENNSISKIR